MTKNEAYKNTLEGLWCKLPSKVTSEILFVDSNLDKLIGILDGEESSSTRLSEFIREIKKGNHTIAYDNHRKSRLLTMKNELKNFNSLLLNFNR